MYISICLSKFMYIVLELFPRPSLSGAAARLEGSLEGCESPRAGGGWRAQGEWPKALFM